MPTRHQPPSRFACSKQVSPVTSAYDSDSSAETGRLSLLHDDNSLTRDRSGSVPERVNVFRVRVERDEGTQVGIPADDAALISRYPKERLAKTLQAWLTFVPKIFPVAKNLARLRETDTEAAVAWADRMDDLQEWLLNLMHSLRQDRALQDHWTPEHASQFFWAQTSVQVWGLLKIDCGWSEELIAETMWKALADSLLRDKKG